MHASIQVDTLLAQRDRIVMANHRTDVAVVVAVEKVRHVVP